MGALLTVSVCPSDARLSLSTAWITASMMSPGQVCRPNTPLTLRQHPPQPPRTIRKPLHRRPERVEHRHVQVRQRRVLRVDEVLPGPESAAGAAGDDDGEVVRVVAIAVAQAGAEEDHRVVEDRAVALLHVAQ